MAFLSADSFSSALQVVPEEKEKDYFQKKKEDRFLTVPWAQPGGASPGGASRGRAHLGGPSQGCFQGRGTRGASLGGPARELGGPPGGAATPGAMYHPSNCFNPPSSSLSALMD